MIFCSIGSCTGFHIESYRPDCPPPCSRPHASSTGRMPRPCTTPARTGSHQTRRYGGLGRSAGLLWVDGGAGVWGSSHGRREHEGGSFLVSGSPGLHLRVRMVWILLFLREQGLPSVYISRISFPGKVCGDVTKLPRLSAWLFLSEVRHISKKCYDALTQHCCIRWLWQCKIETRGAVSETLTNGADGGVDGAASSAPCGQHFVADVQVETRPRLLGLSVHGLPVLSHTRP